MDPAMSRAVLLALVLVATACSGGRSTRDAGTAAGRPAPTFRIAFLTDVKGYLEPCGCTSRPLGGVHRLGGMLERLARTGVPTVVVAAGDLFVREGGTEASAQQDSWQAETLVDVFGDLGVLAAVPGRMDRARGDAFLGALRSRSRFEWLGDPADSGLAMRRFLVHTVGGTKVAFVGVTDAFGATSEALVAQATADATAARAAGARMVVVLLRGDRRLARSVGQVRGVDFVVHGGLDSETPGAPTERGSSFVLEGGRQGQRVAMLDVYLRDASPFRDGSAYTRRLARERILDEVASRNAQLATWERDGTSEADLAEQRRAIAALRAEARGLDRPIDVTTGNVFVFDPIELAPGTPERADIARRMDAITQRVNDHNREAFAGLVPEPAPAGTPHYVGSEACASCHAAANGWWQRHPHGRAYATLTERHHEFDLQCVGCHVTGYGRPGGSTVTHNLDGALVNVGCESCHGPGSSHVAAPGQTPQTIRREVPETVCVSCHNHEHSDHFQYDTYRDRIVVPGHGLPIGGTP